MHQQGADRVPKGDQTGMLGAGSGAFYLRNISLKADLASSFPSAKIRYPFG